MYMNVEGCKFLQKLMGFCNSEKFFCPDCEIFRDLMEFLWICAFVDFYEIFSFYKVYKDLQSNTPLDMWKIVFIFFSTVG